MRRRSVGRILGGAGAGRRIWRAIHTGGGVLDTVYAVFLVCNHGASGVDSIFLSLPSVTATPRYMRVQAPSTRGVKGWMHTVRVLRSSGLHGEPRYVVCVSLCTERAVVTSQRMHDGDMVFALSTVSRRLAVLLSNSGSADDVVVPEPQLRSPTALYAGSPQHGASSPATPEP